MVACTNHSVAVDNWAIRNLCRYCNSTIHLHIILMKKIFAHINSVGKIVNIIYSCTVTEEVDGLFSTKLIVKTILFTWDKTLDYDKRTNRGTSLKGQNTQQRQVFIMLGVISVSIQP